MTPSPGMLVLSLFIIGTTIYIASVNNDTGAWWYVAILLLGMMLILKGPKGVSFVTQLYAIGFKPPSGNTNAPQPAPGQTTGPY